MRGVHFPARVRRRLPAVTGRAVVVVLTFEYAIRYRSAEFLIADPGYAGWRFAKSSMMRLRLARAVVGGKRPRVGRVA